MTLKRRLAHAVRAAAFVLLTVAGLAPGAHALRIVNYNMLNYSSTSGSRNGYFQTIFAPLDADIIVTQEMTGAGNSGVDLFRDGVLNVLEPGEWASAPFINGNDTDNALFYKPARVQFLGGWAFYPNPANLLRLVNCYRLKPVGYADASAELRIYSQHLKAGNSGAEIAQKAAEATGIRDSMNAMPPGTHALLVGDFNIYRTDEAAFTILLASGSNNTGRLYDPFATNLLAGQVFNHTQFRHLHTQSACLSGCPGATSGLDDRFDMLLPTYPMKDGEGLDVTDTTNYVPVGNDGQHYNANITDAPTIPEGAAYATALFNASDHLPVRWDVQVPAKISAPAAISFGTVIVGATATQTLAVSNPAIPPADELNYALAPDPGFTAPGGVFVRNAGAPAASHAIGMNTGAAGQPAGDLLVTSDDPDQSLLAVPLSGTVLDHAQASLDSTSALLSESLDFGDQPSGGFTTRMARVHDRGYHALRARLSVTSGVITGGDGRFSIVGGFSPALVAGTARTYTVQFDDAGATPDQDYTATLTLASADEPLPGATAQPDLTVSLRAKVVSGTTGVPGTPPPVVPTTTRLHPPAPNPLDGETVVRFDLAREARLDLEIFDLGGRRVATLARGTMPPGQYGYRWQGTGESGAALGSGLYFVRLSIAGERVRMARLAIVR